jgi:hypothetical protein
MKSMFIALATTLVLTTGFTKKPNSAPNSSALHSIHVTDALGLLVNGTLDVTQFVCEDGLLWAKCKLRGTLSGLPIDEDCLVPVTVGDCDSGIRAPLALAGKNAVRTAAYKTGGDCNCITINFGPCTVRRLTGALNLNPCQLVCTAEEYSSEVICGVSTGIRSVGFSNYQIAGLLNQLL